MERRGESDRGEQLIKIPSSSSSSFFPDSFHVLPPFV